MQSQQAISLFQLPIYVSSLLNFIILYLVLRKIFFKPVMNYLDRRRQHVASDLESADEKLQKAREIEKNLIAKVEQAERQARDVIAESKRRAGEIRDQNVKQAKHEADIILRRAHEEAKAEVDEARQEMVNVATEIASALTSRLLRKEITTEIDQRLIDEVISRIEGPR